MTQTHCFEEFDQFCLVFRVVLKMGLYLVGYLSITIFKLEESVFSFLKAIVNNVCLHCITNILTKWLSPLWKFKLSENQLILRQSPRFVAKDEVNLAKIFMNS